MTCSVVCFEPDIASLPQTGQVALLVQRSSRKRKFGRSNPDRDKPKSLKQVVIAKHSVIGVNISCPVLKRMF